MEVAPLRRTTSRFRWKSGPLTIVFWTFTSRLSREYLFLEGEIQQLVRSALDRGRVEVNDDYPEQRRAAFLVNSNLVRGYMEAAERLKAGI